MQKSYIVSLSAESVSYYRQVTFRVSRLIELATVAKFGAKHMARDACSKTTRRSFKMSPSNNVWQLQVCLFSRHHVILNLDWMWLAFQVYRESKGEYLHVLCTSIFFPVPDSLQTRNHLSWSIATGSVLTSLYPMLSGCLTVKNFDASALSWALAALFLELMSYLDMIISYHTWFRLMSSMSATSGGTVFSLPHNSVRDFLKGMPI